ncbi:VWA domain-containing protein [bacterium]|nr:VWA domain-containing protein [bacterium]
MTDPNYSALLVVLDRSGSMTSIQDEMQVGLQTLVDEQAKEPGMLTIDLIQFDNVIEAVYTMKDAKGVKIELDPRGGTALYDALGVAINGFSKTIEELPEHARPSKVTLIAVTDGEENSSQEYDLKTVKKLIQKKQKDERWEMVFLGANQDAVLSGQNLGFEADASLTFDADADGVNTMASSASRFISDARSGNRQGFSDTERGAASRGSR